MIYLDYNATTPLDKRVLGKMLPYFKGDFGNPSSIYRLAQNAKMAINDARKHVAGLLSVLPEEIVFTSGGTESNNTAIKGIALCHQSRGNHIITSKIEHDSVLNTYKFLKEHGFETSYIKVDKYGVIDLEELERSIRKNTILVSIMHANNETGTIQPIKEISEICRKNKIYFHSDAVQTAGKIALNVKKLGVDLLSVSAHKLYGPKGVGALYIKKGVNIYSLLQGGHHEMDRRAGTENVAGIVGLGQAAKIAKEEIEKNMRKVKQLQNKLEEGIKNRISEVKVNGHPKNRLYNTLNISIKYIEAENVLINLDFVGICVSSGSACASGSLDPSHVLLAMGIPVDAARSSLRFSLGKYNTDKEIEKVLTALPKIVEKLRKMSPFWRKGKNGR